MCAGTGSFEAAKHCVFVAASGFGETTTFLQHIQLKCCHMAAHGARSTLARLLNQTNVSNHSEEYSVVSFFFCVFCVCFHSDGGGPPGCGVPVHHNTRGYRPAAVLPGPEPDLPVRSTVMEEASQPREGEDEMPTNLKCQKIKSQPLSFKSTVSVPWVFVLVPLTLV